MASFGIGVSERLMPSAARWHQFLDVIAESLRFGLIAQVQTFNAGPPATVDVLACVKELAMWNQNAGQDGQPVQIQTKPVKLPLLTGVPVMLLGAGGWTATFPIQQGDECVVLFMDTAFDSWLQAGGTDNNPISQRRHSLSDGIAIFGIRNNKRGLSSYSTSSMQIRSDDGSVAVDLTSNQITMTAPNVQINASSTATIQADTINIEGSSAVNITGNSQTKIENRVFLQHLHSGVATGAGSSGPVE